MAADATAGRATLVGCGRAPAGRLAPVIDPRTPVIVGVAQSNRRPTEAELDGASEPVDMMADVVRAAADDAGVGRALLDRLTGLRAVRVTTWHYEDTAGLVMARLGISPGDASTSPLGGSSPQRLLNEAADAIRLGAHDAVVVCGAEASHTVTLAQRHGFTLPWTPDTPTGEDKPTHPQHPAEEAVGLRSVREYFPLMDNAIRSRNGTTAAEHSARIGRMWSNYSAVAAENPFAWSPRHRSPSEITTVTDDNRMISFPYTKVMNAYARVDQAAAVIVCSLELARALGIADDRYVFPLAGAQCHEHWFVSERVDLGASVGMRANASAAFGHTGLAVDDVAHLDLYACFPAPAQLAAEALGLPVDDPARPLTCTGGLAFAGGPGNNYMTHAIANVVGRLRGDPGAHGLVSGIGWYATTHAMGVYGTEPGPAEFRSFDVQDAVDSSPRRAVVVDDQAQGALETFTVTHDRHGEPERAVLAVLTPDGARAWGVSTEAEVMVALETEELLGRQVTVSSDRSVVL